MDNELLALIKQAKAENWKSILLNSTSLESIPIEIYKIKSLRAFSISNGKYWDPREFGILHHISTGEQTATHTSYKSDSQTYENAGPYRFHTVSENFLKSIPQEIAELDQLESLQIIGSAHFMTSLPPEIGQLVNLEKLIIENTQILELPREINSLKKLIYLNLGGNNLPIPPEILRKFYAPKAILNYYFVRLKKPLNEIKLIIMGQGSVGKTSLVQRIINGTFDQNQSKTNGISINQWQTDDIKLNLWDFGGQEIMHATHQFFFTERSLYLLILDSRLTQEENRIEYWLNILQSFGGESPVLIVGNKTDEHPLDIDRNGLQKKYSNIVGILETSAATGAGIEELKAAIAQQVNNLPHVRDLLPETWFTIKTRLEGLGRESNFITHDKYLKLCVENEVRDEISQRTLLGFLHDLGVVLHFQDDPRLEALGILNPQWVTNGVYKILNSQNLFHNKGILTMSMLDEILNLPEYPRGKRLFIVDMMKKFELCYDIDGDIFLVPDLLPKDEPAELKFTGISALEYAYPVLPSSIITRFIVRVNQHIHDNCVWRTGVMLKIGENQVLVKADIEDRKITIAIDGLEHSRRDALSAIRYQLDEIHNSITGLNPEKFVPVPGAVYAKPVKYDYLLKLERAGQETLLVEDRDELKEIIVSQVLNGVESEYQRRQIGGNVTNNFNIKIAKNAKVGDIILASKIQNSFNRAESANIQVELKETLKQLAKAVDAMTKSLSEKQAAKAVKDLEKLVNEATEPIPNKEWYSVSINGLIKAAENVGKVGGPVIDLSRKVLSLLNGGVIK